MNLNDLKNTISDLLASLMAVIVFVIPIAIGLSVYLCLLQRSCGVIVSAVGAFLLASGVFALEILAIIKTL